MGYSFLFCTHVSILWTYGYYFTLPIPELNSPMGLNLLFYPYVCSIHPGGLLHFLKGVDSIYTLFVFLIILHLDFYIVTKS
nr:MAG TPA: hypothetical protein [Caudoviricetes sp.]